MFNINLETALIKENKNLIKNSIEVKQKNEYLIHKNLVDNSVLDRIGLNKQIRKGKQITEKENSLFEETKKFDENRVFHISQIKKVAIKFYLRFLNTSYYKGGIDELIPAKVLEAETNYNIICDQKRMFILAPKQNFKLTKNPKDPLLFYKINDEYYYLIHKWGNDLNIFRRLKPLLSKKIPSFLIVMGTILTICYLFFSNLTESLGITTVIGLIILIINGVDYIDSYANDDDDVNINMSLRLLKKNKWNSTYI